MKKKKTRQRTCSLMCRLNLKKKINHCLRSERIWLMIQTSSLQKSYQSSKHNSSKLSNKQIRPLNKKPRNEQTWRICFYKWRRNQFKAVMRCQTWRNSKHTTKEKCNSNQMRRSRSKWSCLRKRNVKRRNCSRKKNNTTTCRKKLKIVAK